MDPQTRSAKTFHVPLVYPGQQDMVGYNYQEDFPVGLLYVAQALNDIEVSTSIIDARKVDIDSMPLEDALFVGFTVLTGDMITRTLDAAKKIREHDPSIPIVWGGVHATLLPEQTLEHPLVDIIVIGEGEAAIQDLATCLIEKGDLANVKGIAFKNQQGQFVRNPPQEYVDLDSLDYKLPYDQLDYDPSKLKKIPVHTSRGCPWRCAFCYNVSVHNRSYRVKSSENVLDEIEYVVNRFNVDFIDFTMEDEFFINKRRVREILEGIVERKLNINWTAFIRFDTLARLDDDYMELLVKSGCSTLSFGAESGSQRLLDDVVLKDVKVETIVKGVQRLRDYKIPHLVSFICGFPTETKDDVQETFKLIKRLSAGNEYFINNCVFLFCPIPGTWLYDNVRKDYGWEPFKTLEDWGSFQMPLTDSTMMTWLDEDYRDFCKQVSFYSTLRGYEFSSPERFKDKSVGQRLAAKLMARIQDIRIDRMNFKHPIEFKIYYFLFGGNTIFGKKISLYWRIRQIAGRIVFAIFPSLKAMRSS